MKPHLPLSATDLVAFCARHGIARLSVFGSVQRGTDGPDSDLDLLVEFLPGRSPGLIGLASMQAELSALAAGRVIDLRTPADLSQHFRAEVLRTAELAYAA